jgi:hypothetical protein
MRRLRLADLPALWDTARARGRVGDRMINIETYDGFTKRAKI